MFRGSKPLSSRMKNSKKTHIELVLDNQNVLS